MATLLNIFLGLVLGGLVVWFLIGPGHEQNITREADEKIIEYTATMASQEAQISELQSQVDALNETTASAQQQVDAANQKTTSYENLMKAVDAYQQGNTSQTSNTLMEVNTDDLSVEAKAVYDEIYADIQDDMFNELKAEGEEAFDNAEYTTAIDRLTKAREINAQDYVVLNRLAHAYRETGDTDNAIATFQEIINAFPGTERATRAASQIEQLGGTPQDPEAGDSSTEDSSEGDSAADEESSGEGESSNPDGEETE